MKTIITLSLIFSSLSVLATEVKFDSTYINQAHDILKEDLIPDRKPASIEDAPISNQNELQLKSQTECKDKPCN